MAKSDFWDTLGDWDQILNFLNFQPKSFLRGQTRKRTIVETEIPLVTKKQWPKATKIRK